MAKAEYIGCTTYGIVDYFDVIGGDEGEWIVNNVSRPEGYQNIVISDDATDVDIIKGLKAMGWLSRKATINNIEVDWVDGNWCEFTEKETQMPMFRLVAKGVV